METEFNRKSLKHYEFPYVAKTFVMFLRDNGLSEDSIGLDEMGSVKAIKQFQRYFILKNSQCRSLLALLMVNAQRAADDKDK